jgi:Ras-related protein Rab-6A
LSMRNPDFVHKIVFLGDTQVGKTSLIQRYVYDTLSPDMTRTIGAVLHVKTMQMDGEFHKQVIWDLGGEESFAQLREQYCANASGAFFVFDRTNLKSLEHIDNWLNALYLSAGKVIVIAVENKIDLESAITDAQIQGILESRGLQHIQTSALQNTNVNIAFEEIVKKIRERMKRRKS